MNINDNALVPTARIAQAILVLRGQKVIIDADLAALYGVPTKRLNEQVKRNSERFPPDFMLTLTAQEKAEVVANCDHLAKLKFSKTLPYAFTEHGAIQAANVLNSPRAVQMGVYVVRAFVRLREAIASNKELTATLNKLERKVDSHDQAIVGLMKTLRELMRPPEPPKQRPIGFVIHEEKPKKRG